MNWKRALVNAVLLLFAVLPILVYLSKFGTEISADHTRWSEFGSAIGGIYSPILALAALAVLAMQARMQQELNKHQYDQAYFSQARSDIEFYATRLSAVLRVASFSGKTLERHLNDTFHAASRDELVSPSRMAIADQINLLHPEALAAWMGIYPILKGLQSSDEPTYRMTFTGSIQKLIALLGIANCVALDNYHFVQTENRLNFEYEFSRLVGAK